MKKNKLRLLSLVLVATMLTACNAEDTSVNSQLGMHNSQSTVEESSVEATETPEDSVQSEMSNEQLTESLEVTNTPVPTKEPIESSALPEEPTATPIPDDYESDNNSQSAESSKEPENPDNYELSIENSELVATATPAPTATPKSTATPKPVATPEPTPVATAAPTEAPTEAPAPVVTEVPATPAPVVTPAPTAEPTPAPTEAPAHQCAPQGDLAYRAKNERVDLGGNCYKIITEEAGLYCSCGTFFYSFDSRADEYHNETNTPGVEPTCTEAGYANSVVCDCGAKNGGGMELPATGHHLEEELGDQISATENPDGTYTVVHATRVVCTKCGYVESEGTKTF